MSLSFADPLVIALIVVGAVALVLLGISIWMFVRLRRFLAGIDAHHVSESLTSVSSDLKDLQKFRADMESYLTGVEKRLRKSVRAVETVRFNPFKGTGGGGNQSFSTAFIDEEGDGVIISSLYARDHVSVFGKPVRKHSSEYELSEEERQSLDNAKKNLN